jgi:hypothetical protein
VKAQETRTSRIHYALALCSILIVALLAVSCGSAGPQYTQAQLDRIAEGAAQRVLQANLGAGSGPDSMVIPACKANPIQISYSDKDFASTVDPKICYAYPKDVLTWVTDDSNSAFDGRFTKTLGSPFKSGNYNPKGQKATETIRDNVAAPELHRYVVGYKNTTADPHIIIMPSTN